jgi:phenylalanyl-tRNA synthetase beta chain
MKISEKWLRDWVNPDVTTEELVETLTMAGLEVDGIESLGEDLIGVLVGKIEKAEQHPEADKLQVCQVNVGEAENLQIICGAPNAREGLKVAVATIGCTLPGDFKIKKAKLRGVHSFGMLCSAKELSLSEESDGIIELADDAVIGQEIIDHLSIRDTAIDIDLTPNRGDCLGIKGVATEVGVLTQSSVNAIEIKTAPVSIDDKVSVNLGEPKANPRFVARVMKSVNIQAQTPEWMTARLTASDIRSIDPVVDVTNYVMLELGHPMHAFDLNNLSGAINIRRAKPGEKLILLDDQEIELRDDTLVVADDEKVLSMAGIMGGKFSGINPDTQDLLLEVAHWEPVDIAGKARSYGLHTDASHRFERGVDYSLCVDAMERATELLLDIVGGQAGPIVDEVNQASFPEVSEILLRRSSISKVLGIDISDDQVEDILGRLGMSLKPHAEGWQVKAPASRFDIAIEVDLIEELVRVYGYNNVPSHKPMAEMAMIRQPENKIQSNRVSHLLADRGYQEVITYSFVDEASQSSLQPEVKPLPLVNPISAELAVMRTSLWTGLLKVVSHNQKRQSDQVRIFESGLKFVPQDGKLEQIPVIAGAISGRRYPQNWQGMDEKVDFYDLKGDLEAVLSMTAESDSFSFKAIEPGSNGFESLHPGQSAEILRHGKPCGVIGQLHPKILQAFDLDEPVFLFELALQPLLERSLPKFTELSKFPAIRRDLAVLLKESVTSSQIIDLIGQTEKNWLNNISIFDVYRGKGIDEGYKSVALSITLQRFDRTFKDKEITKVMDRVIDALVKQLGAELRD